MTKGIQIKDGKGNIVMELKGAEIITKEPTVDSLSDFVSFLKNINFRLEKLENEVENLKKQPDYEKVAQVLQDKLELLRAKGRY